MKRDRIAAEAVDRALVCGTYRSPGLGIGRAAQMQGGLKLLAHVVGRLVLAVQVEAEIADADLVESAANDVERCLLLGNEQHRLVGGQRIRDQVRDRLRLARARRALEHERSACLRPGDRLKLRAVDRDRAVR